jgi:hypothetical protein
MYVEQIGIYAERVAKIENRAENNVKRIALVIVTASKVM